jgi:hypothetical protein
MRDLLGVLFPRVCAELKNKPKQRALMELWVEALGHDAVLPTAGYSKCVCHCVRLVIRRHLRKLAVDELGLDQPTGREMLLK